MATKKQTKKPTVKKPEPELKEVITIKDEQPDLVDIPEEPIIDIEFNPDNNYDTEPKKKPFNGFLEEYKEYASEFDGRDKEIQAELELIYNNLVRQYRLFLRPDNGKGMTHPEAVEKATQYVNSILRKEKIKNIMEE